MKLFQRESQVSNILKRENTLRAKRLLFHKGLGLLVVSGQALFSTKS